MPGNEIAEHQFFNIPYLDKIAHFSTFLVLGVIFRFALPRLRFWYFIQIMMCYGFLIEILQDLMHWGRSSEFLDVVADTCGAFAGFYLYRFASKLLLRIFP